MKVCILGPMYSEKHYGGIATFDEGLKKGLEKEGHEVLVITDTCKKESVKQFKKIDIIVFNKKILREIKNFKPDLVISSMYYGLLNRKIKKDLSKTIIIQFIHGFPTFRYGMFKKYILNKMLKYIRRHSDHFVSNSKFTSCINNEIYGIKVDKYIHLGLDEPFVDFEKVKNEVIKCVFAGRLVEEKNVDKVCEIFGYMSNLVENLQLTIIGDGPEMEKLKNTFVSDNINFIGRRTRTETLNIIKNSDIFISLNPHEPFGLVFLEALLYKCKIICPNTGGQTEFLANFREVMMVDMNNYKMKDQIYKEFLSYDGFSEINLKKFFDFYNYRRVARELIEFIKE